jgi:Spy/CpxP family protein refolding chaperone
MAVNSTGWFVVFLCVIAFDKSAMGVSRSFVRGVLVVLVLVCVATPGLAQRGKWWHDERIKTELGLTPQQSARLEEIFQKTQPVLRQHMRALNATEREFDRRVETGDDASVLDYIGTVEAARAELNKARTVMLLRMRRSLTADQWAKFTALAEERRREREPARRLR